MTNAHDPNEPQDARHHSPIALHFINVVLDTVDEATTNLLETAEHHRAVDPKTAESVARLAVLLMQTTRTWLQQVLAG